MRQLRDPALAILAALVIVVGIPATAGARDVQPTGGNVTLRLSSAATGRLKANGVSVVGRRGRVTRGSTWDFGPLRAGGGGEMRLRQTLRLRRGPFRVVVRDLRLAVARKAGSSGRAVGTLTGVIGTRRFPLAELSGRRYSSAPGRFEGLDARLSPAAVGGLNGALQTRAFSTGERLGEFVGRDISQVVKLSRGTLSLSLSDEALALLRGAGADVGTLTGSGGAVSTDDPATFSFRRFRLDLINRSGVIAARGGLRFTLPPGSALAADGPIDAPLPRLRAVPSGYIFTSGGRDLLELRPGPASQFDLTSRRIRQRALQVRFTRDLAAELAPSLGTTVARLRDLDPGRADIEGNLRR